MAFLKKLNWFWVVLVLLLFLPVIFTTKIQFSCYPLITNGELRQVCYQEPNISKVITDIHTHGSVLYNIASSTSDESILRKLFSNLEIRRVDYDSKTLEVELLANKNTPSDLSEKIFNDLIDDQVPLQPRLLEKLALNSNTPDSILQSLILNYNQDYINSLISNRSQLSSNIVTLLFQVVQSSQSSYKDEILSNIAFQENTSSIIVKRLLEQAKILEKLEDDSECPIYEGLSKNPTLEEKLGKRKYEQINNRAKECKKKRLDKCTSKRGRNVLWGLGAGATVLTGILIIGSGGLLAPIALGGAALAGGAIYTAGEFLSKCP